MPRSDAAARLHKLRHTIASHWVWIALAIPLVLAAIAAAILIWPIDRSEGPYPTAAYRRYATPSTFSSLFRDGSAIGDLVFLNEVQLVPAAKANSNAFLARGAGGKYLLVVTDGRPAPLQHSAIANVQGVIRSLPSPSTIKHEWKLTAKQLSRISGEQVYLDAQRIRIDANAPTNN
jgi:hypothetical protein